MTLPWRDVQRQKVSVDNQIAISFIWLSEVLPSYVLRGWWKSNPPHEPILLRGLVAPIMGLLPRDIPWDSLYRSRELILRLVPPPTAFYFSHRDHLQCIPVSPSDSLLFRIVKTTSADQGHVALVHDTTVGAVALTRQADLTLDVQHCRAPTTMLAIGFRIIPE